MICVEWGKIKAIPSSTQHKETFQKWFPSLCASSSSCQLFSLALRGTTSTVVLCYNFPLILFVFLSFQGMDSGFAGGEDETYNVYDQPFRGGRDMASHIYRAPKNTEKDAYADDLDSLMQNKYFDFAIYSITITVIHFFKKESRSGNKEKQKRAG